MTTPNKETNVAGWVCIGIIVIVQLLLLAFSFIRFEERATNDHIRNVVHEELDKVFHNQYSPR